MLGTGENSQFESSLIATRYVRARSTWTFSCSRNRVFEPSSVCSVSVTRAEMRSLMVSWEAISARRPSTSFCSMPVVTPMTTSQLDAPRSEKNERISCWKIVKPVRSSMMRTGLSSRSWNLSLIWRSVSLISPTYSISLIASLACRVMMSNSSSSGEALWLPYSSLAPGWRSNNSDSFSTEIGSNSNSDSGSSKESTYSSRFSRIVSRKSSSLTSWTTGSPFSKATVIVPIVFSNTPLGGRLANCFASSRLASSR